MPASDTTYIPTSTSVLPGQAWGPATWLPSGADKGSHHTHAERDNSDRALSKRRSGSAAGAGALSCARLFPLAAPRAAPFLARQKKGRGAPLHGCAWQDRAPTTGDRSGSSQEPAHTLL